MSITNVPTGGLARAIHVQQIINWLRGNPSYSEPVSFTGISSQSGFALTTANLDATLGRGLRVYNSSLNIPLLDVEHAGTKVRANTNGQTYIFDVRKADDTSVFRVTDAGASFGGLTAATLTGTEVLTNKTLTAPILQHPVVNDYLKMVQQGGAPATPPSGSIYIYSLLTDEIPRYKGSSTGVEKILVDLDTAQTLTGKTIASSTLTAPLFSSFVEYTLQGSDPSAPGAGKLRLYGRSSDGFLRTMDSSSNIRRLIDESSSQTLTNKTLTSPSMASPTLSDYIEYTQIATPTAPVAGKARFYSKTGTDLMHYRTNTSGEKTIVDTDTVQTLSNKTLTSVTLTTPTFTSPLISNYGDFSQSAATPGNPGAGKMRLWAKTDNNAYMNVGGVDQTILTSANTSIAASTSLARPMILGTL